MVKKDIIDTVLTNFLTSNRSPNFMSMPEYDGYPMDEFEPNRQIFMSSAWFKNHWSWDKFVNTVEEMINPNKDTEELLEQNPDMQIPYDGLKKYCALTIPYTLPLYHGILPLSKVENDLDAKDYSSIKWSMEMEGSFFGQSEFAFYSFDDIDKAMKIKTAFLPNCKFDNVKFKSKNKEDIDFTMLDREEGEIRVISADVGGTGIDQDIYVCIRCIPEKYGKDSNKKYYYRKEVVSMKHISVAHSEIKARVLKQLKEDFQADWIVMDTNGTSQPLYEACCKVTYDDIVDKEYPAWTAFNDEKLDSMKMDKDALPIIYSVRAYAQFNHDIANTLREELKSGKLYFLQTRDDAESDFNEYVNGFQDLNDIDKTEMLISYDETYLLMIELTNLEAVWSDKGLVSIEKPSGGKVKRDRYSALAYGVWYCRELEKINLNKSNKKKSSFGFKYTPQERFTDANKY